MLSLSEFRRRAKGSEQRASRCAACHLEAERERQKRIRAEKTQTALHRWSTAVSGCNDIRRVEAITRDAMAFFGGPTGFFSAHHELLEGITDRRVKTPALLRTMEAIFHLVVLVAHQREKDLERLHAETFHRVLAEATAVNDSSASVDDPVDPLHVG